MTIFKCVIHAGIRTLRSELAKIKNYVWDKKEFSPKTESVFVTVNNKTDKTDCSKYSDVVR
jgi:hypothetical protein